MSGVFALYLLVINVFTFTAFAADKRAAERQDRRTPERHLLTLAMLGGTPGAIAAQQLLRHKTRKEPFRTTLWSLAGLHLAMIALAVYRLI